MRTSAQDREEESETERKGAEEYRSHTTHAYSGPGMSRLLSRTERGSKIIQKT